MAYNPFGSGKREPIWGVSRGRGGVPKLSHVDMGGCLITRVDRSDDGSVRIGVVSMIDGLETTLSVPTDLGLPMPCVGDTL